MHRHNSVSRLFLITVLLVVMGMLTTMCAPAAGPEAPEEPAGEVEEPEVAEEPEEAEEVEMEETITLAIEHFSVIEGTTWSGSGIRQCRIRLP